MITKQHPAHDFLALIDPFDSQFTFQTFDDRKGSKRPELARVFHGKLSEHIDELTRLNDQGAGVFVTINRTDLKGRKKENITDIRAVFVDSDSGDLPELPLAPSILVQSKQGQHAYWLLTDGQPLNSFKDLQEKLASYLATDSSVKDLPRVMRLPGFYHMKNPGEPFMVKVISSTNRRFTAQEIENEYSRTGCTETELLAFKEYVAGLSIQEGVRNPMGGRDNTLYRMICEGLGRGLSSDVLRTFVRDYCIRSGFDFDLGEEKLVRQAKEHLTKPFTSNYRSEEKMMKKVQSKTDKAATTSSLSFNDVAYDIARIEGHAGWISYKKGSYFQSVISSPEIEVDGKKHISPTTQVRGANLITANGIGQPQLPEELFYRIKKLIRAKFKTNRNDLLDYVSLYVLASYNYDSYTSLSYLSAVGSAGSGKSRLISTAAKLSYNCFVCTGADTSAAFIRSMDLVRGSIAMDESQRSSNDPGDDYHKILAVGNSKDTGYITKCEKVGRDEGIETRSFNVFGPKMFSQRYSSTDDAIISRTVEFELPVLGLEEIGDSALEDDSWEMEAEKLRNDLLFYRQRRKVGEITSPNIIDPLVFARAQRLSARELQVNRWLIQECPVPSILESIQNAIQLAKTNALHVRALSFEAEVLFLTLELMRKLDANDFIKLSTIREELLFKCGFRSEQKTIAKVLRGNGLSQYRKGSGTHFQVNIRLVELAIQRLGLDLPGASLPSFASSSSFGGGV
jgi:hypothetical protein